MKLKVHCRNFITDRIQKSFQGLQSAAYPLKFLEGKFREK